MLEESTVIKLKSNRAMAGQGEKPRASPHPDRGYGASKDTVSRRAAPCLRR